MVDYEEVNEIFSFVANPVWYLKLLTTSVSIHNGNNWKLSILIYKPIYQTFHLIAGFVCKILLWIFIEHEEIGKEKFICQQSISILKNNFLFNSPSNFQLLNFDFYKILPIIFLHQARKFKGIYDCIKELQKKYFNVNIYLKEIFHFFSTLFQ